MSMLFASKSSKYSYSTCISWTAKDRTNFLYDPKVSNLYNRFQPAVENFEVEILDNKRVHLSMLARSKPRSKLEPHMRAKSQLQCLAIYLL